MSVVNSNIKALIASQAMLVSERSLGKAMTQLSTGKRINSASDDAAGLAISNKLGTQIRSLNQAVRNANDAVSMIQTADGAAEGITHLLIRMRELAVQATNGTNSTSDKTALQSEFSSLQSEITRISDKTTWNGLALIGADASATAFQIGPESGSESQLTVTFKDLNSGVSFATAVATTTSATATTTITHIDDAISALDVFRSDLGARINRLTHAADNLTQVAINSAASRSRIVDTDYAQTTSELARAQIVRQAGTAMLAQANQQPAFVLALLR
jgi:flagellin